MRVAFVNQDRGVGPGRHKGSSVHVAAMQAAFRALGCELVALEEKEGRRVTARLAELHEARPLDLVYERYALGADAAGRFSRRAGVAHVLEANAPLLEEAVAYRGARHGAEELAREARILGQADAVFAVSGSVADHVASLGISRGRIRVHPNAVDARRFVPIEDAERKSALGLRPGAFVIGFHGRLRPWHGFERVAEAARRMIRRGRNVHVVTVGEGAFAEILERAGLAACSTCLPWVSHEQVPELVACFDALPLAYAPDAPCYFSPLKLLEAMACGVVPVVPDLGDLPDVVGDGAAGLVYPAGSLAGLTRALELLADDDARRQRLAEHARARACSHSWEAIAREALELASKERVG